ncbi:hypothetical protein K474DRAFT_886713 [Panus rudis PR-1116 ss-1]|nr:hypothetical protein K474DRAFT_886713 [Panus rudis PR-1116 ss-1]
MRTGEETPANRPEYAVQRFHETGSGSPSSTRESPLSASFRACITDIIYSVFDVRNPHNALPATPRRLCPFLHCIPSPARQLRGELGPTLSTLPKLLTDPRAVRALFRNIHATKRIAGIFGTLGDAEVEVKKREERQEEENKNKQVRRESRSRMTKAWGNRLNVQRNSCYQTLSSKAQTPGSYVVDARGSRSSFRVRVFLPSMAGVVRSMSAIRRLSSAPFLFFKLL